MVLREIDVQVGLTINLGNYENVKINAGAKATLAEGEDHRAAYRGLYDIVSLEVKEQTAKINSDIASRFRGAHS